VNVRERRVIWTGIILAILPVSFAVAQANNSQGQTLAGTWLGTLSGLRIVFNVKANPNGALTATLDSPDQGATGLPVSRVSLEGGKATFESSMLSIRYEAAMSLDGSALDGQWTQSGVSFPLTMKRVDELPKPNRHQEPKKPYPYMEEEVTYHNVADSITLAGTLTIPRGNGPFPAVLLITGSGAEDRDEAVFGHRPFLVLADFLTRRGIAVLRVDDRGIGGSTGNTADATGEDLSRDVLAGISYLKTRKEIDPKHLGLIGHSDGGNTAPLVATRSQDVSFIVMMAGTGLPGEQIIEGQIMRMLKAMGVEQAVMDISLASQKQVCAIVRQETDAAVLKQKVREAITTAAAKLDDKQRQTLRYSQVYVDTQVAAAATPWFRYFISYDPRPTLGRVRCPVLVLNGELDMQVWADENLPEVEKALKTGGNTDVTIRKLPKLNHLFQTAQTGAISEYTQIEETISPSALEIIAGWIASHTQAK
jgi:pimeloyl-ACP methyl ester carboxylesterase